MSFHCIPNVVPPEELEPLVAALERAAFVDGKATAGRHVRGIKRNLQLTALMAGHEALDDVVRATLLSHPTFMAAVRPKNLSSMLFNRHDVGMSYGEHVDNAVMGCAPPTRKLRTDVSFTVYLSDPASYDGGELELWLGDTWQAFKLSAGAVLAYPSSTSHRVTMVTRGSRLAAVGWAQSEVRDPMQRTILFDMDQACQRVFDRDGKTDVFDLLARSHTNLLRMWIDV